MATKIDVISGIPYLVSDNPVIYDETYVAVGTITAGTAITLPNSGNYDSTELEVYLDGTRIERVADYNYVGASAPRTQITLTIDLENDERLRFIKRT